MFSVTTRLGPLRPHCLTYFGLVCCLDEGVIIAKCMQFVHALPGICESKINGLGMMFVPCSTRHFVTPVHRTPFQKSSI